MQHLRQQLFAACIGAMHLAACQGVIVGGGGGDDTGTGGGADVAHRGATGGAGATSGRTGASTSSTSSSSSSTGTTTGASSSTSAGGGAGGAPSCTGGGSVCTPFAVRPCPCGSDGTGTETCNTTGDAYSACACPPPLPCSFGAACPPAWCEPFPSGDGLPNAPLGLVADTYGDLVLLNEGKTGTVIVKLDPSGAQLDAFDVTAASALAATPDGGFVVAGDANSPPSPLRVQRFDHTGNVVFDRSFAATDAFVSAITTDAGGDTFVAGAFNDTIDFGCFSVGPADPTVLSVFVAKLDPVGTPLWAKKVITGADGEYDGVTSLSADAAGNLFLVGEGSYDDVVDFGAGPVPRGGGLNDLLVAKLDPNGAPLWATRYGKETILEYVWGKADAQGNVVVVGNLDTPIDFGGGPVGAQGAFVATLDAGGNYVRSFDTQTVGGTVHDFGFDPSGNLVLAGVCGGAAPSDMQACVSRWTPAGELLAAQSFGDAAMQEAFFVAVDGAGHPTFAGPFLGSMDVGSGPVVDPNAGQSESTYVARALLP